MCVRYDLLVAASDRHRRGDCGIDTSRDAKKGLSSSLSRPSFDSIDFLFRSGHVAGCYFGFTCALFRIIAVGKRNRWH